MFPSVHVAGGRVVHLVKDGQVPEPVRTDPVKAALAFQEQGATWLHLVMAEDGSGGFDVDTARRVIGAVDIDVQLMCRAGVVDDDSLARALGTGCTRLNLGRGSLADLRWCTTAIARHGERLGVSLPVRRTGGGLRVAGLGPVADSGELGDVLSVLDRAGCARYVVTDVSREGTLSGPNLGLFRDVCGRTPAAVLAAGGVTTLEDLRAVVALAPHGVEGVLVGRALYADAFTLPQALAAVEPGAGRAR
ncbi:HisA/HisF-related TIM barrel protein [Streptomyces sp. XD-27]|uniref:HisA/HisF-related TIM barrel protein n=1 Tax=Streptomyces sp. XD-27 TaxID=3062779 RepID=UPI0026F474E8|nr:HisA/HisF-related TIM barrel protein [Streptomyces sp. XD-27]WKX71385.1 HisA/HisF-related TIM barrel protein [Streptomyces sp. XD-27]